MQKIKDLEALLHSVKHSVILNTGSKLQEMKTTLINIVEKAPDKTYAEAAKNQPVISNDNSNSFDEGIGNNTTHSVEGDSSQTYLKTTYRQHKPETKIPTPNPIPVSMTNIGENRCEKQRNGSDNSNSRALRKTGEKVSKNILIIGDSFESH